MKHLLLYLLLILNSTLVYSKPILPDDLVNTKSKYSDSYVANPDNILSHHAVLRIDSILYILEQETSSEVLVIAIKDIGHYSAHAYALEVFEKWGIGKEGKDNGAILILALDNRETFILTGYALEGALTDAKATRVVNNIINPYFGKGDFDRGMIEGVAAISDIIRKESDEHGFYEGFAQNRKLSSFMTVYLILTVLLIIYASYKMLKSINSIPRIEKTERITRFKSAMFPWLILGIFFPMLLLYIGLWYQFFFKPRARRSRIKCDRCSNKMKKLSDKDGKQYLQPYQSLEKRLRSKDYDVWLCNNCGNTRVYGFDYRFTPYSTCEVCKAKTKSMVKERVVKNPTLLNEGLGQKEYLCRNCGNRTNKQYRIPKAGPAIAGGAMGGLLGGGRRGGGMPGGGSWGGGRTGGGGGGGRF